MDLDELIRTRRTQKAYEPGPIDHGTLDELFELARWAPNHHLTNPWRFRVVGPSALEALKAAAGPESASKLDRAPTLVAASVVQAGDPVADEEDFAAAACASFIVLLGAHSRGLDGYWRTPDVPTMLLAGQQDLSTPVEWARREARTAPHGHLMVVPGAGHSVQLQAIPKALAAARRIWLAR